MTFTLNELAKQVNGQVIGDSQCVINRVATLERARAGQIAFLSNSKYRKHLKNTKASAVIINEADKVGCLVNAIVVDDPYVAYAIIATYLNPPLLSEQTGIHPSAVVSDSANIHDQVWIGPQCVVEDDVTLHSGTIIGPGCLIGKHSTLGEGCRLDANVTIWHDTQIGKRALIHPGVVIGADGFGIAKQKNDQWIKVPQLGRVCIGDDVEIGANTTIDRGALEDTVIGDGVKLDNLIQVAHNVHIGQHTVVVACSAIAGSAKIGKNCRIAGAVGIVGHIEITDNVTVTAMSMVTHSITEPGVYSSGTLLEKNSAWQKNAVRIKQLDKIARKINELDSKQRAAKGSIAR